MRLLLPKPAKDWARWRAGLADLDTTPICIDPWHFEWQWETPEQRTVWLNLDEFQGVICVSARAAEGLVAALDRYWPMPPIGIHWLCNGSGTAAPLTEAGLRVHFPERDNTAEAVLQLPETQAVAEQKWLVVKGEGGRDTFARTLSDRGAEVTELRLYRRSVKAEALSELVQRSKDAEAILVSSQTLAAALMHENPQHWRSWPGQWWLTSPRLLDWAVAEGIPHCRGTRGAALEQVRQALIERTRHGGR
ncbi:uroporphyrinogen-III synthase [Saccharospirillum salsuginis]|uniref:Uroporphyrinogen-III synthase n=1 Tax=Saccharospirillum salsuginis TaxID=418750 RepID=A0A918K301_9GAMM|nr:uroporphyrinogen-III synthase [Saccharospirillum salsuginis]GGX44623.1 uroporphyrinogen-III synthase [Saccharospirillum salsuginis]